MDFEVARSPQLHNPIPDGCVLYLPLWHNELSGSVLSSCDDFRHACTVTGATWGSTGRIFAGGDDLININAALTPLAANTTGGIGLWVMMPDATPAAINSLYSFGDTNAIELIDMRVETDGKITCQAWDAGTAQWVFKTNAAVMADNTFKFLLLVQNGTSPVLYVNGSLEAITYSTSTDKTKWFSALTGLDNGRVGCISYNSSGNVQFLTGTVGEAFAHSRALSAGEIQHIYQVTKWRYS